MELLLTSTIQELTGRQALLEPTASLDVQVFFRPPISRSSTTPTPVARSLSTFSSDSATAKPRNHGLQLVDRARKPRIFRIAQIQLLPWNPVRVLARGAAAEVAEEADADVEDREAFEETVAADEVVRHEQLVAIAIGEELLDSAYALPVHVDDARPEQQLQLHLSLL